MNTAVAHISLGAECEEQSEAAYACTVIGPHSFSVEQSVDVAFSDGENGGVDAEVEAGELIAVYGTTKTELMGGVFHLDNHNDGSFEYQGIPLSAFENPSGPAE